MFSEASVCPQRGLPPIWGLPAGGESAHPPTPPRYWYPVAATAAVGTHPTGMHSCYEMVMNHPTYRDWTKTSYLKPSVTLFTIQYEFYRLNQNPHQVAIFPLGRMRGSFWRVRLFVILIPVSYPSGFTQGTAYSCHFCFALNFLEDFFGDSFASQPWRDCETVSSKLISLDEDEGTYSIWGSDMELWHLVSCVPLNHLSFFWDGSRCCVELLPSGKIHRNLHRRHGCRTLVPDLSIVICCCR